MISLAKGWFFVIHPIHPKFTQSSPKVHPWLWCGIWYFRSDLPLFEEIYRSSLDYHDYSEIYNKKSLWISNFRRQRLVVFSVCFFYFVM